MKAVRLSNVQKANQSKRENKLQEAGSIKNLLSKMTVLLETSKEQLMTTINPNIMETHLHHSLMSLFVKSKDKKGNLQDRNRRLLKIDRISETMLTGFPLA